MTSPPPPHSPPSSRKLGALLRHPASGGVVLMTAAVLALVIANSAGAPTYFSVLATPVAGLSVLHWVNDGLMALFFLLVGLEIKREVASGELASWPQRALPGLAALGGMLVPAAIYLALNTGPGGAPRGWAIPSATDIAFALGVLSLLGPRVPASLRLFLTALAIIDDLGAVLIIAVFYTAGLSLPALAAAAGVTALLVALNRFHVQRLPPYLALGGLLWFFMLKSGIHATLAGVVLAMTLPARSGDATHRASPLLRLEHGLQPGVAFAIVPLFGFCNAGLSFANVSPGSLADPVPLGVALGLFIGKQLGVFGFAVLAIRTGIAARPAGVGWPQLYGVALLCGIGFTMSLFIGLLAFANAPSLQDETKLGVLLGSVVSALCGSALLWSTSRIGKSEEGTR